MMRTDEEREEKSDPVSDRHLWQRCRVTDVPENEAAHLLDLAGFADGLLETEERDRVAALLADDTDAAADVRAAGAFGGADWPAAGLERVIARACAIVPGPADAHSNVVTFAKHRSRRIVQGFAQWGSLAAAIALAGWLGFSMGSDASLAFSTHGQPSEPSALRELFDQSTGFLTDLSEGLRT